MSPPLGLKTGKRGRIRFRMAAKWFSTGVSRFRARLRRRGVRAKPRSSSTDSAGFSVTLETARARDFWIRRRCFASRVARSSSGSEASGSTVSGFGAPDRERRDEAPFAMSRKKASCSRGEGPRERRLVSEGRMVVSGIRRCLSDVRRGGGVGKTRVSHSAISAAEGRWGEGGRGGGGGG